MAREASKATETASYERGVLDFAGTTAPRHGQKHLIRQKSLADSKLRRADNVFFPKDIREVPAALPPPVADPLLPPRQLPTIQAPTPDAEVLTEARKGKEVQPPVKANQSDDTLTIQDMVSKAKDAESKSKAADPKEDPHQAKA